MDILILVNNANIQIYIKIGNILGNAALKIFAGCVRGINSSNIILICFGLLDEVVRMRDIFREPRHTMPLT